MPKLDPDAKVSRAFDTEKLPKGARTDEDIDKMLDYLLMELRSGGFYNAVDSISVWWEEKGFLTEDQYEVIERTYLKQKGRRT